MKLSDTTISVLKNYSTINQNLMIKAGSNLSTMSAMKNIVASAEVSETFERDVAIYDLNEFLATLSLFNNPDLDFQDDYVVLSEEGSGRKARYWYSDPSVVTTLTKEITMPDPDITFSLSSEELSDVTKAAAVIGAPDMCLDPSGLKVTDKKNDTANDYSLPIVQEFAGERTGLVLGSSDPVKDYKFWFKVENLKILPGTYDVSVSSKNISKFSHTNGVNIEYFIALEPESKYSFTPYVED